jgi:hypothetical protein
MSNFIAGLGSCSVRELTEAFKTRKLHESVASLSGLLPNGAVGSFLTDDSFLRRFGRFGSARAYRRGAVVRVLAE